MEEIHLRNYAYLGDAVWELYIREKTVLLTENAKQLHKLTTDRVKAGFQSELFHYIEQELTETELELARRGRNLSIPIARRSNQVEYRTATAFEVLIGWWYKKDKNRLNEIMKKIDYRLNF